jgi:hypothetical protein
MTAGAISRGTGTALLLATSEIGLLHNLVK